MSDQPFGDRHGPTPDEMRRAFDARTAIPPRTEPSRYDRLSPFARALVDDYDALDLAEMLVAAQDQLAALRQVARGYCPHCGRGDAGVTTDQWEQQRQRADQAEAALARVRRLATLIRAGAPWTANHDTLADHILAALDNPAATQATNEPHTGLVVQPYRNDHGNPAWVFRCWGTDTCDGWLSLDHTSEQSARRARDRHVAEEHATPAWTEPTHDHPCTATIKGRATPGGRQVQCTREAGHPENHVGPKQGSNGRVLWTDRNTGAVPHRRG